jgi:hypothetical protein
MKRILVFCLCFGMLSCSIFRKSVKPEKEAELIEETAIAAPAAIKIAPVNPGGNPGLLKSPVHFLPSYQTQGGPYLLLDSVNAVVKLDQATLAKINEFWVAEQERKTGVSSKENQAEIVRYFAAKLQADDLLGEQITADQAQQQPHFKGVFNGNNNLLSLEYIGKSQSASPVKEQLSFLYATRWDLLFNRRLNYIDNQENRPPPHVKVYADPAKTVRLVEYINKDKQIIARGIFTYGIKNLILEQRIEFPQGGKLTDLHPDFFDNQFEQVRADWVVKCLFNSRNLLSDLIVMEDVGNIFYRYHFQYEKVGNTQVVEAFVYNNDDNPVGRYELYFDEQDELAKKIVISVGGSILEIMQYQVDYDNLKSIVDYYDKDGLHVNRIYRDL